jgi:hypothetical protein
LIEQYDENDGRTRPDMKKNLQAEEAFKVL